MKHTLKLTFFLFLFVSSLITIDAQNVESTNNMTDQVFQLKNPDYKLSPYTGMTRQHWKDAALYVLKGAFSYIHTLDDPMKFPKQPGKSYPGNAGQVPTEKLEGICRTLFYATPLLKYNPNLVINNIRVADYYRHQIGLLLDPMSLSYIKHRVKNGGPNQILVEFGALSISLFAIPDILWKPLPQNQKDALAATMLSYGDGPTVPSNWKFFNIFVLSFFKSQGYSVNENLLKEYLEKSIGNYRGDGWYNDNPAYDYYSMWAFQLYGMLWSEYFGKTYYPEYAQKFLDNFKPLKENYPYMFSKKGEMIMWGRSISYRYAAVAPFSMLGFENNPKTNYGWMRRIASGTLLQFLQNPDFMKDSIPTLGFYGPFEPAVQSYSCRGSIFWSGKAFLGLLIPADNPFWTAPENNGAWENEFVKDSVYNKFSKHTGILITDYPNIGASEIRAWCHATAAGDWQKFRSTENYNRLSYNSAFPWQADGENGEVAMNYVVKNKNNQWEPLRLFTFKKFEDGIYYRDVVLETDQNIQFKLAEMPLSNGILRIDKIESPEAVKFRLGHYALPQLSTPIKEETRKVKGHQIMIIDNGVYQLAMVTLSGRVSMQIMHTKGLHPQSELSKVINVSGSSDPDKKDLNVYITLMLWKKSGEEWTNDNLLPVKKINYSAKKKRVTILFVNGEKKEVSFE